ncbi:MAG: AP2/ERF family transcription factor [Sedimentisphaerales bacterium]
MKHVLNVIETVLVSPVLLYRFLRFGYTYRRIYLGEGKYTILDSQDYYRMRDYRWHLWGQNGRFYVVRIIQKGSRRMKKKTMHREIMNAPKGKLVDHKNSNPQDNRRNNLRLATYKENGRNKSKRRKKTSSKYIGVSRCKNVKSWRAQIGHISLGSFDSEIDAAKAYDEAAKKYYGVFAKLNFPEENSAQSPVYRFLRNLRGAKMNFPEPQRTPISRIIDGVKGAWGALNHRLQRLALIFKTTKFIRRKAGRVNNLQ